MSWNTLAGHNVFNPDTWNWDPQCQPPAPVVPNITGNITAAPCEGYCAGFLYPLTWEIEEIRKLIYPIFLYIGGVLYCFLAIAIICDEFFVPALERISKKFNISPDVAGATLMAAGGSAPELCTSFVGTLNESPVGFGTIVGSAVFNVLFVIGACAFAAPSELELDWWPLFRDSFYYCLSLMIMAIFFGYISPSRIYWYEALCLFLLYIIYVIMMNRNTQFEACINKCLGKCRGKKKENGDEQEEEGKPQQQKKTNKKPSEIAVHPAESFDEKNGPTSKDDEIQYNTATSEAKSETKTDSSKGDDGDQSKQQLLDKGDADATLEKDAGGEDDDDDDDEPLDLSFPSADAFEHHKQCKCCKLTCARIMYVIAFPLNGLFYITVPDVRREDGKLCGCEVKWKDLWLPAFIMSIAWIVCFSYFMVWWAEILGKVSGIHPTVVGLTLLAAGTSIPDLVSSVLVARKGEGNMAVSSSIGSNIFDILICLPLPWLIYSIYKGATLWGNCPGGDNHDCFYVGVFAETLLFSVTLLIVMIFIVILIVHLSGWKMTKGLGISMLVLYFIFLMQDILRNCEMIPATARWFTWLRTNTQH